VIGEHASQILKGEIMSVAALSTFVREFLSTGLSSNEAGNSVADALDEFRVAQAVNPAADSGAGSTILPASRLVDVGAVVNDADDWLVMPALADVPVGHTIVICNNAGANYELRTPATSGEKINNVDADGTQELLCTDTQVVTITKVSAGDGWTAVSRALAGGIVAAAVTPN
jgi:hypothetical protein